VSIKLITASKTVEFLRRGPETKRFWATPVSPDAEHEAANTWMGKVDKLSPTQYLKDLPRPPTPADAVLRIEYLGRSGEIGFLDLLKYTSDSEGKGDYYLKTEITRGYATVSPLTAETVESGLDTLLK
jgi:hypothetical protein